jgi:hypothetical protein
VPESRIMWNVHIPAPPTKCLPAANSGVPYDCSTSLVQSATAIILLFVKVKLKQLQILNCGYVAVLVLQTVSAEVPIPHTW